MEVIRGLFERRTKKDNRGMSFVEVLCAVAIFSLIASTVAGVVVVCARLYRNGVADTSIQQEAQFTANQIGGLIKDANRVEHNDGTGFGTDPGYLIFKTDTEGYFVVRNATNSELNYYTFTIQPDGSMPLTGPFLLSENVSAFSMNYPDFDKTRAVDLVLTMDNGDRNYNMSYTMTARNEVVQEISFSEVATANIDFDNEIYMVPGETWNIPVSVAGETGGIDIVCDPGVTVDNTHYNPGQSFTNMQVTLDKTVTEDTKTVIVKTVKVVDGTTTPVASRTLTIRVRRVNAVGVTYTTDSSGTARGTYEEPGAEFTFYANVTASNPNRKPGKQWDNEWKQPNAVIWEASVTINGASASLNEYFDKIEEKGDATTPTVKYKLKKAMPAGMKFTVKAISLHRRGTTTDGGGNIVKTNKNGASYCDLSGNDADIYGVQIIEPRETKLEGLSYMVLEPNETATIATNIKSLGAVSSGIKVEVKGAKDSNTSVSYADGNLTVKIGKEETGMTQEYKKKDNSGNTTLANGSGIIKVILYPEEKTYVENMSNAAEVYVFVRRVTGITLGYKIMSNEHYTQTTPFKAGTCYQFKTKLKGTNLNPLWFETDQSKSSAEYLRRFGAEFKWQFKKDGVDTDMRGSAYRLSDYDSITDLAGNSQYCEGVFENEYVRVSLIGVNGSDKDEPVLNLELKKDYPKNTEFEVTSTLLHPEGTYTFNGNSRQTNNTGLEYDNISAVTSLNSVLDFEQECIVADPTQGLTTRVASAGTVIDTSHMLCVPIEVKTTLRKLNLKIEGNQKPGTQVYTDLTDFRSNGTSYVYLGIDKDEPDSNDLKLIVDAVSIEDSNGDYPLVTLEIPIHIRRVTDVTIKKKTGYNSIGITLKFDASADGLYGTQYFEPHRSEDGTKLYPWDTKGYNGTNFIGYQTPYAYKWSLSFDEGATWHDFVEDSKGNLVIPSSDTEMNKYIESVEGSGIKQEKESSMSGTSITTERQKSIEFTLKKKLPDNSQLKLTSLHAAGNNRGGMFYEDVYDIYTIKDRELIDCDIKRGTDCNLNSGFTSHRSAYDNANSSHDAKQRQFFRYREIDGDWSRFHMMIDKSEANTRWNYEESLLLLPDKEYEIEIVCVVFSENDKVIFWPHDDSLLEQGKGWVEEGYKKAWDDDAEPTDPSEYQRNYYVGKVEVTFAENKDWGVSAGSHTFGDYGRDNPIPLKTGDNISIGMQTSYFDLYKSQHTFMGKVDKLKSDGTWENLLNVSNTTGDIEKKLGVFINMHIPSYDIYNIHSDLHDTFRICTYIKDMKWYKFASGSTLMNPVYESYTETYELYNLKDDTGVTYVKFN